MDTFSSDTAFFDASEQIEPPPADAPGPSIPEERPAPHATKCAAFPSVFFTSACELSNCACCRPRHRFMNVIAGIF